MSFASKSRATEISKNLRLCSLSVILKTWSRKKRKCSTLVLKQSFLESDLRVKYLNLRSFLALSVLSIPIKKSAYLSSLDLFSDSCWKERQCSTQRSSNASA